MSKKTFYLLLAFLLGVLGNAIAAFLDTTFKHNVLATCVCTVVFLLTTIALESHWAIIWNWRWHRHSYLYEECRSRKFKSRPSILNAIDNQGRRHSLNSHLVERIRDHNTQHCRLMVLGDSGAGKTVALEQLYATLVDEARASGEMPIPVLIPLGTVTSENLWTAARRSLGDFTRSRKMLGTNIETLAEKGAIALLLDAADEGGKIAYAQLVRDSHLEFFAHIPIIVTARRSVHPQERLESMETLDICELDDDAVTALTDHYLAAGQDGRLIRTRLADLHLLDPGGLARNPFWLALLIQTDVTSAQRGQLLKAAVQMTIDREWDKPSDAKRPWIRSHYEDAQRIMLERQLCELGYCISEISESESIPFDTALTEIEKTISKSHDTGHTTAHDVLGFAREAHILHFQVDRLRREFKPIYFRHRLLREFFAAEAISYDVMRCKDAVTRHASSPRWWGILFIVFDLVEQSGAAQLDEALGAVPATTESLWFTTALYCQRVHVYQIEPHPDAHFEPLSRLVANSNAAEHLPIVQALLEANPETLGGILSGLITLGAAPQAVENLIQCVFDHFTVGPTAAVLLRTCLADHVVADWVVKCRISLGASAVPALIDQLHVPNNEFPWRVVDILGRLGDPRAIGPLSDLLDRSGSEDHPAIIESIGHMGAAAVPVLLTIYERADETGRFCTISAFKDIGPVAAGELVGLLGGNAFSLFIVEALRGIGPPAAGPLLAALPSAKSEARFEIHMALGCPGNEEAIPTLVNILESGDAFAGVAVQSLGQIGPASVGPLLNVLQRNYRFLDELHADRVAASEAHEDSGILSRILQPFA